MKYLIIPFLVLTFFSQVAYSDDMIFYKYADGDKYSVLVSPAEDESLSLSARDVIAKKMLNATFSLENVSKEHYKIISIKNITFFGENITQHEIIPLIKDRFRHVVWIDSNDNLIKTETFDNNDKLMVAFSNVDFHGKVSIKKELKDNLNNQKHFYKGFYHTFTKKMPDNVVHHIFSDGVNKFSVFINPNPEDTGSITKIVYGNYLLSKTVSNIEYTVIGSIPYSTMDKFIDVISSLNNEINNIADIDNFISKKNIFIENETEEVHK